VSADNRVNSDDDPATQQAEESAAEPPRWWIRKPAKGVITAAILGIATTWVTLSIKSPDSAPGTTLLYIVILPIALLLPAIALSGAFISWAIALSGAFISWHAFQASRGRLRLLLAAPAAVGLVLNAIAVGLFMRWVGRVFFG